MSARNAKLSFYCSCLLNRERENMVQRPIICGWEILKINLACLLSRSPNPNQRIGGAYLGNLLRREPLYVFAKRLLQRDAVIIDFEALFPLSNDWQTLYEKVEKQSGIKGFASVRQELGNDRPVQEIYSEIRRRLGTAPPFALEVAIWQDMCLVNPYIERAAEIGVINGRPVRILGILPYPREAVMKLIGQTKARKAELKLERKFSPNQLRECFDGREPRDTAVVSSVYSRIKAAEKNGQKGLYYESPRGFMRKIHHPALSRRFQLLYDGLCGVGLFSGE